MTEPTTEPDEWTPRERGLMFGHSAAESVARSELRAISDDRKLLTSEALLNALAQDPPKLPEHLRRSILEEMAERLAASDDPDAEAAFWSGFSCGVRAFIRRTADRQRRVRSRP
jgi:hypothetical protein